MAYTARQYEAQRRIQAAISQANAAGLCVVCMRRPQATWPDGVRRITSDTASLVGLTDRGVLRPGAFADLNVIDLDALALPLPTIVHDFPGGAARFVQRAEGIEHTVVNGRPFMEGGRHTGDLAGRLLRSDC